MKIATKRFAVYTLVRRQVIALFSYIFRSEQDIEKVIIFGFGRSGSTLLSSSICYEEHHLDLGEFLRPRKYFRSNTIWFISLHKLLVGTVRWYAKQKTRIIIHIKPYHLRYFGIYEREFLKRMDANGWKIIILERAPDDIILSEYRARVTKKWINTSPGTKEEIRDFLPNDLTEIIEEMSYIVQTNINLRVISNILENCILINYESDLSTEEKQARLVGRLKQFGLNVQFNGNRNVKNEYSTIDPRDLEKISVLRSAASDIINLASSSLKPILTIL